MSENKKNNEDEGSYRGLEEFSQQMITLGRKIGEKLERKNELETEIMEKEKKTREIQKEVFNLKDELAKIKTELLELEDKRRGAEKGEGS